MMELRNCERCNRAFIKNAPLQVLCQRCIQLEEEEFVKVKDYLYKNPGAGVEELTEALDIPQKTILRFLQSGRLAIKGNNMLICQNCGKPIDKGTMCPECQHILLKELQSVSDKPKSGSNQPDSRDKTRNIRFHTQRPQ